MKQQTVLVVDDDPQVRRIVTRLLEGEGMNLLQAATGSEALSLICSTDLDLVILDIMMDGTDGFRVVKETRRRGINTPIMILSGRSEDHDTVFGLGIGADDYVSKPFSASVLCAKAKALIRRSESLLTQREQALTRGPFLYDRQTMKLYKDGQEISLTGKELMMVRLFLENENQVFTKEMLYSKIWDDATAVDDNTIMVYIRRLRAKLEDDPGSPRYLRTIRGVGYQFTTS